MPTFHPVLHLVLETANEKEIAPTIRVPALRYGQPAVLRIGGVWLNSPSAQTTPALIRQILRSSAQPEGGERGPDTNTAIAALGNSR
jgi:hypothetical protein